MSPPASKLPVSSTHGPLQLAAQHVSTALYLLTAPMCILSHASRHCSVVCMPESWTLESSSMTLESTFVRLVSAPASAMGVVPVSVEVTEHALIPRPAPPARRKAAARTNVKRKEP